VYPPKRLKAHTTRERESVKHTGTRSGKERVKEAAIQALLVQPTIELAAEASGISRTTLYRFLAQEEFQRLYKQAKSRVLDETINRLRNASLEAVEVLVEVSNDVSATSSARVSAARSIIDLALRAKQIEDIEERLQELEANTIEGER
jgi:hypothetical protein